MDEGTKDRLRRRLVRWQWFWLDLFSALATRGTWVLVGNAATLVCAVAGVVHYWSRPLTFAGYVVLQLACLGCQAVALIPVARPGRAATPRDVSDFSELHQSVTISTVCGSWIFAVLPGAGLLALFDVDTDSPPWAAVFFSGSALMVACIAGGITAALLSHQVSTQLREAAGPPGGSDWADGTGSDTAVDSGGFDGD